MPSFLHPGWLLLLLLLPFILLGAVLAARRHGKAWKRMVAPRLQTQLVHVSSPVRRWVGFSMALLGCALLVFALARPYLGQTTTTERISTRNILIAMDTSRSMLVQDGSPDRMASAKAMAIEVLEAFPNDRVGIVAFSGKSVLMAPLTIDHAAIQETIGQLDTHVIPSGGSDLGAAVDTALGAFKKTGQRSNALIIISDGEDHSEKIDLAAANIRESRTVVCAIGVGSTAGGIIPDADYRDGKFRDNQGRTVHSKMHPEALDTLARAGRGSFTPASSGSTAAIRSALESLERDQQASRETTVPNELFQWFLLPAVVLLALSLVVRSEFLAGNMAAAKKPVTRPPALPGAAAAALLAILPAEPLHAATLLQQAEASYSRGDYEKALSLFSEALPGATGEDRRAVQFSIGSAAYKTGDWNKANNFLSASLLTGNIGLREQAHYNLGNSLFMTAWSQINPIGTPGQAPAADGAAAPQTKDLASAVTSLEDCIGHYRASLDINPENSAAKHNLAEAEKLLEQLKQQQKKQDQQQDPNPKEGDKNPKEKKGEQPDKQKNDGDQPEPDPDAKKRDGDGDQPEQSKPDRGEQGDQEKPDKPDNKNDRPDNANTERREGETEEAYAARVLKENSDAETRPVQRRLLRLRRPAKDW